jgi:hypothetical protein
MINLRSILDPNTVVATPAAPQGEEPPPRAVRALPVIGH